ncbi:Radical SAM domain family protein [Desulfamplus magnetovallimortis]|uniref:Radical SAM domain family protein n=2 Tax=Desulfamplus magnetovallimortis TaxID=1246637 RepID=A0A1W1HIR0_9BACT|nr:Radical SAM domain family protein [Desulfamplus magnetovallimortis]
MGKKQNNQVVKTPNNQVVKNRNNNITAAIPLNAVVANEKGEIFELEDYGAAAMQGEKPLLLTSNETIEMPHGSELMMLPGMKALVFNFDRGSFETLDENPYLPGERIFPVAVFNSPGYVNRYFCAYEKPLPERLLPLFSYGACGWSHGGFYSAAICVDREPRQDLRLMPHDGIVAGVEFMRQKYPENRLMRHLERCALEYGCPAAKNFFLGRYEAPLPTSRVCNADCMGCISFQRENNLVACQERINFTPFSVEIAEVTLEHFARVPDAQAVASFGQGCEGDPLTAFDVIEPAIKMIRESGGNATINMNTNAGLPLLLARLFDAGLDSVRVSMNSVRKSCYLRYFRPKGYSYEDVIKSIETAGEKGKFVSINYLNCPGVTDSEKEFEALRHFLAKYPVNMIQWRNMNYDPLSYFNVMQEAGGGQNPPLGMEFIIQELRKEFPELIHGYFNPPVRGDGKN